MSLQRTGKLKPDESLVEVYSSIARPANPKLGTSPTLQIADPKWNQMMDNADAQIGPSGELFKHLIFKGTERSQVAQAVIELLDPALLQGKAKAASFNIAMQDAVTMKKSVQKGNAFSTQGMGTSITINDRRKIQEDLLKTYPADVVTQVMQRLD